MESIREPRYLAAKLFFGLALISVVSGLVLRQPGYSLDMYLNPVFLIYLPRLMPFALAIISAVFGAVYLVVEKGLTRPVSVRLAVVHLGFLLLAAYGHLVVVRFWSHVLGDNPPANPQIPLWSVFMSWSALIISIAAFFLNLLFPRRKIMADS